MIYELVNPSDKYEFEAEHDVVAAAVGIILGRGRYGVWRTDGLGSKIVHVLPVFLFGGAEEGFKEGYGINLQDYLSQGWEDICNALDTVTVSSRRGFLESGQDRATWHDAHRTSMNDIGAYAWRVAENVRKERKAAGNAAN